jgi:hypothetical protein
MSCLFTKRIARASLAICARLQHTLFRLTCQLCFTLHTLVTTVTLTLAKRLHRTGAWCVCSLLHIASFALADLPLAFPVCINRVTVLRNCKDKHHLVKKGFKCLASSRASALCTGNTRQPKHRRSMVTLHSIILVLPRHCWKQG